NEQIAVGDSHTDRHDCTHQGLDVDGRASQNQHPEHAGHCAGNGQDDDEGFEPGLKIRHHQQVDEHARQTYSCPHRYERLPHCLTLASYGDPGTGGQLAEAIYRPLRRISGTAEVASVHAAINVDHTLHGVMGDYRWIEAVVYRCNISK